MNALAFEVVSLGRAADDKKAYSDYAGEKSDGNDANSGSEGRSQENTPDSSGKDLAAHLFPLILIQQPLSFNSINFPPQQGPPVAMMRQKRVDAMPPLL